MIVKREKINLGRIVEPLAIKQALGPGKFILADFEDYIRFEKQYSQINVKAVVDGVKYLVTHYDINVPTKEDAYRVQRDQELHGLKTKTIRNRLEYIRLISEYHCWKHKLGKDQILDITLPPKVKPVTDYVNIGEGRRLRAAATNRRDLAIISFGLTVGARPCEFVQVMPNDLDLDNRRVYIRDHGQRIKNHRERVCRLNDQCVEDLQDWLDVRPASSTNPELFLNKYGLPLSEKRLNIIVKDVATAAKFGRRCYYYMLRHGCAVNIVESGGTVMDARLQLGHSSLDTTWGYLHSSQETLARNIQKLKY